MPARARREAKSMSDESDPKESGLVPGGNKALTTRSSALVKRGLEALASQQPSSARFPSDRSWKEYGRAVLDGRDPPFGLTIGFEDRPHDPELGRLEESTVWVNTAHPAYRRAVASRSEGYHLALSVAMSLAPLAVESSDEVAFVSAFLSRWGERSNPR